MCCFESLIPSCLAVAARRAEGAALAEHLVVAQPAGRAQKTDYLQTPSGNKDETEQYRAAEAEMNHKFQQHDLKRREQKQVWSCCSSTATCLVSSTLFAAAKPGESARQEDPTQLCKVSILVSSAAESSPTSTGEFCWYTRMLALSCEQKKGRQRWSSCIYLLSRPLFAAAEARAYPNQEAPAQLCKLVITVGKSAAEQTSSPAGECCRHACCCEQKADWLFQSSTATSLLSKALLAAAEPLQSPSKAAASELGKDTASVSSPDSDLNRHTMTQILLKLHGCMLKEMLVHAIIGAPMAVQCG